ncbi:hypothetical protein [Streptomyces cavernae]|uniref:hypothetical protein n=1 Tax=Streptomyces cavernae TaxID=2259034 RepID=UPI000FEB882A|nr:hypothetical protein [Streptomyces cavernae]
MPVSPLPRRSLAGIVAALALTAGMPTAGALAAAPGFAAGVPTADAMAAAPGFAVPGADGDDQGSADHDASTNKGDIKIHKTGTPFSDERDEPKVCGFHLAAFGFGSAEGATWAIEPHPAGSGGDGLDGALPLRSGTGHTLPLSLPDGRYKLTWRITGGSGVGRSKTFTVDCTESETPGASSTADAPRTSPTARTSAGAVPGGTPPTEASARADVPGVSTMGTMTAVGLVAVSTAVYFRLLRRRSDEAV